MTGPPGTAGSGADPLPLRALRLTLDPGTVAAPLDELTVVRTPTRPDFREGNALHLRDAPTAGDVSRLLRAWDERFGSAPGVEHLRIRWVEPAGDRDLSALRDAAAAQDLQVDLSTSMELGSLVQGAGPADVLIAPAADRRQWHGATVLFRHTDWGGDEQFWRETMAGRRQLQQEGRSVTYLATRWGIPVGTATLFWDPLADVGPDHAGLAVVDDVVVHPVHRGIGIGSALVRTALSRHLDGHPRARVLLHTDDAMPLYEALGFRREGRLGGLACAAGAPLR